MLNVKKQLKKFLNRDSNILFATKAINFQEPLDDNRIPNGSAHSMDN